MIWLAPRGIAWEIMPRRFPFLRLLAAALMFESVKLTPLLALAAAAQCMDYTQYVNVLYVSSGT
jgi:hypothetical protein